MFAAAELPTHLVSLQRWLERHARALALAAGLMTAGWLIALALAKLAALRANGLDLAIYQQVFHETARGNLFGLTIHPHSYLGDHAELLLLALVPLYALLGGSAGALIILQALALAAGGLLVFRLVRGLLGPLPALAVTIAYLLNPMLHSIALFEFHGLTFAIPLLLGLLVAYQERRYGWYLACALLGITVREDVGLVVAGVGLVAAIERRTVRWWLAPIIGGVAGFAGGLWLTGHFNPDGRYKFLRYFDWLGATPREIAAAAVRHPGRWLARLFSPQTLELSIASLAPFFFLPLLRARWLLPIAPVLIQLSLFRASGEVVAQLHYPAAFLPSLVMAAAAGLAALAPARNGWRRQLAVWRPAMIALVPVSALYFNFVLGPSVGALRALAAVDREDVALQRAFSQLVTPPAALATTFQPMVPLAGRARLYSLHYEFLGHRQLSEAPYAIPEDADTLLVDLDDLLHFDLLYPTDAFAGRSGAERLEAFLARGFRLVAYEDHLALWRREGGAGEPLVRREPPPGEAANGTALGPLRFLGVNQPLTVEPARVGPTGLIVLPVELRWTTTEALSDDYALSLRLYQGGQRVATRYYPLGGGTRPTSRWRTSEVVVTPYRFRLPAGLDGQPTEVRVAVVKLAGSIGLDALRSVEYRWRQEAELGEVSLGIVTR